MQCLNDSQNNIAKDKLHSLAAHLHVLPETGKLWSVTRARCCMYRVVGSWLHEKSIDGLPFCCTTQKAIEITGKKPTCCRFFGLQIRGIYQNCVRNCLN